MHWIELLNNPRGGINYTPNRKKAPAAGSRWIGSLFQVVSVRNRVRQKGLVYERERYPKCCGRLLDGQNAKDAVTTPRDPIAGKVRRGSWKGRFRADRGGDRTPDQSRLAGRINTPSRREAFERSRPPPRQAIEVSAILFSGARSDSYITPRAMA